MVRMHNLREPNKETEQLQRVIWMDICAMNELPLHSACDYFDNLKDKLGSIVMECLVCRIM